MRVLLQRSNHLFISILQVWNRETWLARYSSIFISSANSVYSCIDLNCCVTKFQNVARPWTRIFTDVDFRLLLSQSVVLCWMLLLLFSIFINLKYCYLVINRRWKVNRKFKTFVDILRISEDLIKWIPVEFAWTAFKFRKNYQISYCHKY